MIFLQQESILKNLHLKISISFVFILLAGTISAKTLIISDIDDTIKRTNVIGKRFLWGGVQTKNPFFGLNALYNALICHDLGGTKYKDCVTTQGAGHSPDIKLVYVTGAPSFLKNFGRRFVKNSDFPIADVIGKPGFGQDTKTFKIAKIAEVIDASADLSDLVLIGDNGEFDADVYEEIASRYGHLNITTYIHTLYSLKINHENRAGKTGHKIYQGQIPYLTAVDLGIDLYAKGFIKKSDFTKNFTKALSISMSRDEDVYKSLIPQWIQCDYFNEIYAGPTARLSLPQKLMLKKYNNNIATLCGLSE